MPTRLFILSVLFLVAAAKAQDHDFRGYWRDTNPPGAYCPVAVVGDGNVTPELDVCRGTFAWNLAPAPLSAWMLELDLDLYVSSAGAECFLLYDVDEDAPDYLGAATSLAVWSDLGSGVALSAERCVGPDDVGSVVFIHLRESAWLEIEAGGWFGVGVSLTSLDGTTAPAPDGTPAELLRFSSARLREEPMLIFADGFETGDVSNWSASGQAASCSTGPLPQCHLQSRSLIPFEGSSSGQHP